MPERSESERKAALSRGCCPDHGVPLQATRIDSVRKETTFSCPRPECVFGVTVSQKSVLYRTIMGSGLYSVPGGKE